MTNTKIITDELIMRGMDNNMLVNLYAVYGELPFHTAQAWARRGYHVKPGENPLFSCYLWKYTNKPSRALVKAVKDAGEEPPEENPHFYQKLSYIYGFHQVEETAAAPDLATVKATFCDLNGVKMTVKGEKTEKPVVWLSGETEEHADLIKANGGIWSNKKGAYWIKPSVSAAA